MVTEIPSGRIFGECRFLSSFIENSGLTANKMASYGQPIIFASGDEMNEN